MVKRKLNIDEGEDEYPSQITKETQKPSLPTYQRMMKYKL